MLSGTSDPHDLGGGRAPGAAMSSSHDEPLHKDTSDMVGGERMSSTKAPLARMPAVGTDATAPAVASSAMHNRYCGLLRIFFDWLFGPIDYPAAAADRIRDLATQGTVVYVARAHTGLLGLYFNHTLARLGLPLARFVGGINLALWQPVELLWKIWRPRLRLWRGDRSPPLESVLGNMLARGEPAFLFLAPEGQRRVRSRYDYLQALVAAQRRTMERPIYILPHVLVGRAQSGIVRGALTGRIFGAGRRSSRLRELFTLVLSPEHSAVRVGDTIDLRALVAASADADDLHLARRLAHDLHRALDEEERVVAGPNLPAFSATRRHVLRSPVVRSAVESLAAADPNRSTATIERRARRLLSEIAARYSVHYVRFLAGVMRLIFSRIYDGIIVDEEGLARVLEAARKGPLVFCPSHKSHVDYLVLSYMLWEHGVTPPHVAAGANLSFFPLGSLFRRAGAFFLRRTFRGDDLYRATFHAYVAELLHTGTSIEFFPEGTRSRSGKLAMPKFGILGMVVDAWRAGARSDLQFVPVSIDYERIVEARSYERELMGADKKSEDIGSLLRSTKVLRSRYGRVHVQFGEPFSLAALAAKRGLSQTNDPATNDAWRRETERLGYRILYDVSQACMVTPTAVATTALLGHRGRGLAQGLFLSIGESIIDYLYSSAARLSEVLRSPQTRAHALLEAMQKLVDEGAAATANPFIAYAKKHVSNSIFTRTPR